MGALADSKKAPEEMASRLPGLGARIQTINAWGYGILSEALERRPQVIDERDVRSLVQKLVPSKQRPVNHAPIDPYLQGPYLFQIGLPHPEAVHAPTHAITRVPVALAHPRTQLTRPDTPHPPHPASSPATHT